MKTLRVGIASYKEMKARSMAIAQGRYRPNASEPKIWFTSAESFARVLSDRNRELLRTIEEAGPESLAELAELTGRKKSNLSRTLKTMERYGLVVLRRGARSSLAPRAPYSRISVIVQVSDPAEKRSAA